MRPRPTNQLGWDREAEAAILDLVTRRKVASWIEIESRISQRLWPPFHPVQPLPLSGARQRLTEGNQPRLVDEATSRSNEPAVHTLRVPERPEDPSYISDRLSRARGAARIPVRTYFSWFTDELAAGRHAEHVLLESLQAVQSDVGLWVPRQRVGEITDVDGTEVEPGPLDALAYLVDVDQATGRPHVGYPLAVENKNMRRWIYPWAPELWQFLHKLARIALHRPVVGVFAAPNIAYVTYRLAQDVGAMVLNYRKQLFHPSRIDPDQFERVVSNLALPALQHEGPFDGYTKWLRTHIRAPAPSPGAQVEDIEHAARQAERIRQTAELLLRYESLAGNLPVHQEVGVNDNAHPRRTAFTSFKLELWRTAEWPLQKGY